MSEDLEQPKTTFNESCAFCGAPTPWVLSCCCSCRCCTECAAPYAVLSEHQKHCINCATPSTAFSGDLTNPHTDEKWSCAEAQSALLAEAVPAPAPAPTACTTCNAPAPTDELFFCDICGALICGSCAVSHVVANHPDTDPYYRLLAVPDAIKFLAVNAGTLIDEAVGLRVRAAGCRLWALRPGGMLAEAIEQAAQPAVIAEAARELAKALDSGSQEAIQEAQKRLRECGVETTHLLASL